MKKAILLLLLVLISGVSFAQTSITGRVYSVRAFGAKGDNSTNDTAAFAAAVTAINASGGTLRIPAGTYLVDAGTVAITSNGITIEGDGPNVTILKSRTNTAGQIVLDTASSALHTVTIKDLTLEGFGSGASNNGITVSGANTPFNIRFSNIRILSFTGRGIYDTAGMFQSRLDNVVVSQAATGNNAIDVLGSNDLLIQNCYVTATGNSTAAYRIHSGRPTLISNNGINPGSTSASWAVFGDNLAEDGADRYVFAVMIGNNLEDFTDNGVRFKAGSYGSFFGNSFIAPSSGTVTPLKFDFVDNGQRGIWDATNSIQTTGATYTNSNALNSRGAPFIQVGGNAFTSYYDTNIGTTITFPYITPQLVAGSSNIALIQTRSQITALESSGLVGDLTGSNTFAGDASRVLLQAGAVGRPTFSFASDTNTGIYSSGADTLDFTAGGTNRLSLATNNTLTGNTGINTAGNSSYALDVASGALRVTNSNGSSTAAVEAKGNSNPYYLLTDSSASAIIGRFQALSGAPDRLAIGSFSNHPFGLYSNSTEKWTVGTSGDFTPGAASSYSIGSSSLPILNATLNGKLFWNGTTVFDNYGTGSPEGVVTAAVGSIYRRTNGASGTTLYVKESGSGNTGWTPITSGAAAPLTATYIGYGDGSNILTGTNTLTWNNTTRTLTATSASSGIINLSTASTNSAFQLNGATHPGTAGGVILPFVGGTNGDAPGLWWTSSASYNTTSGLFLSNGFNFQGATSTHDPVKINAATSSSSSGTTRYTFAPSSSLFTQNLSTASTGATHDAMQTDLTSSGGAGGANLGIGHLFRIENASSSLADATRLSVNWTTATGGSETARFVVANNTAGGGLADSFTVQGDQYYGVSYSQGNVSGAVTVDFNNGNVIYMTVTNNITSMTWSNLKAGGVYYLRFTQGGAGGFTWTPGSNFKYPGGVAGNILTLAAGSVDVFQCVSFDGTNLTCNGLFDVQ